MSHPWAPQPYYLYAQSRTMGPILEPMGGLGAFTVGSFQSRKSPWATPKYVASEPSGVHGFGTDVADCKPAGTAARELWTTLKGLGLSAEGISLRDVPDDVAVPILTNVVSAGAKEAKAGEGRFKSWLQNTFKQIAAKVLGSVVASAVPDSVWQTLAARASGKVWGGMAALEVCTAPTTAATFEDALRVSQVGWQQWACEKGFGPCPTVGTITTVAVTPQQLVKTAMSPTMTAALKKAQPTVKASATPLLLGAAALAALMLLR